MLTAADVKPVSYSTESQFEQPEIKPSLSQVTAISRRLFDLRNQHRITNENLIIFIDVGFKLINLSLTVPQ